MSSLDLASVSYVLGSALYHFILLKVGAVLVTDPGDSSRRRPSSCMGCALRDELVQMAFRLSNVALVLC